MTSKTAPESPGPSGRPGIPARYGTAAAAAVLAAVLLVVAVWVRRVGDFGVETDFYGGYAPRAREILNGGFDPAAYGVVGPVFDLVLAAGMAAGAPAFLFAKLVSLAATVGALVLWSAAARTTAGPRAAAVVPWLLLLSPVFVRHGYLASTDALYAFLLAAAVLATVRARTARGAAGAGGLALLACLTRYQAAVLPLFAAAWFLGRRGGGRRLLAFLAVFPGAGLALAGLLVASGVTLPSPKFLYNIDYEVTGGASWDHYLEEAHANRGAPEAEVLSHLDDVLVRAAKNVPGHLRTEATAAAGLPLALLALAGVLVLAFRGGETGDGGNRKDALRLASLWVIQFVSLLPVQASERYALTQVPLYAVLAGAALSWWRFRGGTSRSRGKWILAAVLAAGMAVNAEAQVRYQERQPRFLLPIAEEARGRVPPGAAVMARKPHLAYLLDGTWVFFPDVMDLAALRDRMAASRPDYVFYGSSAFLLRPAFRFLLFPPYRPPGWEPVASVMGEGVLYAVGDAFYAAPIPEDDATLRALENATLSTPDLPLYAARELAGYMAVTGRCPAALREYRRLLTFTTLDERDRHLMEYCRRAVAGIPDSTGEGR